jgi:hypothetical protein
MSHSFSISRRIAITFIVTIIAVVISRCIFIATRPPKRFKLIAPALKRCHYSTINSVSIEIDIMNVAKARASQSAAASAVVRIVILLLIGIID